MSLCAVTDRFNYTCTMFAGTAEQFIYIQVHYSSPHTPSENKLKSFDKIIYQNQYNFLPFALQK